MPTDFNIVDDTPEDDRVVEIHPATGHPVRPPRGPMPHYPAIENASALLKIFAFVATGVGILSVFVGLMLMAAPGGGIVGLVGGVLTALFWFAVAILLYGVASIAEAVRDIAVNSFKRK